MAARLGEMLVEAGMLTAPELELVLKSQAALGGRLGTNLVEMGLIEEHQLLNLLREKLEIASVEPSDLEDIPPEILALVPRELAHKHRVLPLSLSHKRLTVAMADPNNFQALDEIGFVTGLVIVPCVATERSMDMALERYYGIRREINYIPVPGGIRSKGGRRGLRLHAMRGDEPLVELVEVDLEGERRRGSVEEIAKKLAWAEKLADVVEVLLDYVGGEFDRGAFLAVRGGVISGVKAVVHGEPVDNFSAYTVPLDQSAAFAEVLRQKSFHLGEFPQGDAEGRLQEYLGGVTSAPALLLPLNVDAEPVALVYVDDSAGRLAGGLFELQKVVEKGSLALKMLALRKKILAL